MRLLSLLLSLLLLSLFPSVTPSLVSRLRSAVHHFHPFQNIGTDAINNATNNDILALQYALTLERLDTAFFTNFQQQFNQSWPTNQTNVYQRLEVIRADEAAHTATLEQALRNLGATPVPACNYNFSLVTNISDYIAVGALLENTGVSAYDGAINSISDPVLQQVGATIATVKARHAAYLNHIKGDSPFPQALDIALRSQDVVSAIISLGIVTSCPFELPTIYPVPNPEGTALSLGTSNTTLPNSSSYTPYTSTQAQSDLQTLQLLYQFANLLVAYNNHTNFTNSSEWSSYINNAETYYTLLVNQDQAHSQAIASIISARGGIPAEACNYNFSTNSSLSSFLTTLDSLQTIILRAHDGIINHIYDLELQTTVATIATVHSRHTGYIRELIGIDPFQNPLDNATTPEQAIAQILATGYVISCPQPLVAPPGRAAAPTSAPTNATTSAPTSATSAPTTGGNGTETPTSTPTGIAPTSTPTGAAPTGPTFPGPTSSPSCPALNFTDGIISNTIHFNTTTNKSISYVDVHITIANQSLNYRMNSIGSTNGTKIYTYQLPSTANGLVSYFFTYVTPDAQGVLRGCDSETFTTTIIGTGGAGVQPSPPPCPIAEFDSYIINTTIYFELTSNITLSFVDVHIIHLNTSWNYRMIVSNHTLDDHTSGNQTSGNQTSGNHIYSFTFPSFIDFSVSKVIQYWFTYSNGSIQCDTDTYTGSVTPAQSTPSTSAPTNATTSAPTNATTTAPTTATTTAPTTAPTTATTSAPTTGVTSAPTTGGNETTSAPTSGATSAPTTGNETTSAPTAGQ